MSARHDGYESTTAPRRRRPDALTHFAIVERDGGEPLDEVTGPVNRCKHCGAEGVGMILHPDPEGSDTRRSICGGCQGEANARRAGLGPRDGGR